MGFSIWIALICALLALGVALFLIRMIIRSSPGNDKMCRVAAAIEEGAKAYLNRQLLSIGIIAVIIFFVLGFTRDFFYRIWLCHRRNLFYGSWVHRDARSRDLKLAGSPSSL